MWVLKHFYLSNTSHIFHSLLLFFYLLQQENTEVRDCCRNCWCHKFDFIFSWRLFYSHKDMWLHLFSNLSFCYWCILDLLLLSAQWENISICIILFQGHYFSPAPLDTDHKHPMMHSCIYFHYLLQIPIIRLPKKLWSELQRQLFF